MQSFALLAGLVNLHPLPLKCTCSLRQSIFPCPLPCTYLLGEDLEEGLWTATQRRQKGREISPD